MERETPDDQLCWTAMNPGYQGDGLIDGIHSDYIVDDILAPGLTINSNDIELWQHYEETIIAKLMCKMYVYTKSWCVEAECLPLASLP